MTIGIGIMLSTLAKPVGGLKALAWF